MRRIRPTGLAILAVTLLCLQSVGRSVFVAADLVNGPSLVISQLKITSSNGQFVTLYNAGPAALDMSKYQLEYFNNYDLTKATSSRLITLSGTVPPHGYFMVNDSSILLCFQLTINSVSLGLSSTAGMVVLISNTQAKPGGAITPLLQDYVGWSKTAATGAQTLPANTSAFLQRQPVDASNNPSIGTPGEGTWQTVQPSPTNPCGLVTASTTPKPVQTGLNQLLPATEPPAEIVNLSSEQTETEAAPALPASDIGLMAPKITELLPNPDGTGNDATDEFVELYNPNNTSFDLSGFVLQSGLSRLHKYTFPSGTKLPGRSFTAFYSEETGASLSNTTSQVKLLDPLGKTVASGDVYEKAKDGLAWALAKGKWYWTTSPTPNKANVIKEPAKKSKKSTASAASTTSSKHITSTKGQTSSTTTPSISASDEPATTPIHAGALAIIAGLAILYGAYEYRADIANRIYQLKRYFRGRRGDRAQS